MEPVRRFDESPSLRPMGPVSPKFESTLPFAAMISVVTVLGPFHGDSHRQAKENRRWISPALPCGNRSPWRTVVQIASLLGGGGTCVGYVLSSEKSPMGVF